MNPQTNLLKSVSELKALICDMNYSEAIVHCLDLAIELKKANK